MRQRIPFASLFAIILALLIFPGDIGAQSQWSQLFRQSNLSGSNPIAAFQTQPVDATATPVPPDAEVMPQIIGGEEAIPGAWPWAAALVDSRYTDAFSGWYCGGTLIRPDWVLTAAHCTYGYNDSPKPPSAIDVVIGRHQLSSNDGERIAVAEIIRHPNYNSTTFDYDLALLRLSQPSSYEPLALIPADDTLLSAPGVTSTVIGWGDTRTNGTGSYSDVLRQVSVPIVSNETCNAFDSYGGEITENMLCAGYPEGGQDACAGDSGGPLMVPQAGGGWMQAGVVSWGYDCALPNYYGVYTRVSRFTNWINTQIGSVIISTPTPTWTPPTTATPTPSPTATATVVSTTATATATASPTPTSTVTSTPTATATGTSTSAPNRISGVRISSVRDNSFSVSWLTDSVSTGEIAVAGSPVELATNPQIVQSVGSSQVHWITVTGLTAQRTYYFYVRSDDQIDDNGGAYYQVTTGPTLALPTSDNIYGQVYTEGESPAAQCTVLVEIVDGDQMGDAGASALLSARTDGDGYWSINLGNARTENLQTAFRYSASGDSVAIEVQCGPQSGVGAVVDTADDYPAPPLTVRQLDLHSRVLDGGWNLIALPGQPPGRYTADEICADLKSTSVGTPVEIVRWSSDGWDGYVCGVKANNFEIQADAAYFVRMAGAGVWTLTGAPLGVGTLPTFQLGWNGVNAVGWSHSAADLCAAVPAPDQGVEVNRWYASGWDGHVCNLGFNNFAATPGNGYFLKVAAGSGATQRAEAAVAPVMPVDAAPVSDLRVTNLRDGSVAISWQTDTATMGAVTYSVDGQAVGIGHDVRGEAFEGQLHYVVLSGLVPATTYTFVADAAGADGTLSRGEGVFTTFATATTVPRSQSAYGRVVLADGQTPAAEMLIVLAVVDADGQGSGGRSLALSTLTDGNGWWYANFGNARTENGAPFDFSGEDQIEISVVRAGQPTTVRTIPVATSFPAAAIQLVDNPLYLPMVLR